MVGNSHADVRHILDWAVHIDVVVLVALDVRAILGTTPLVAIVSGNH